MADAPSEVQVQVRGRERGLAFASVLVLGCSDPVPEDPRPSPLESAPARDPVPPAPTVSPAAPPVRAAADPTTPAAKPIANVVPARAWSEPPPVMWTECPADDDAAVVRVVSSAPGVPDRRRLRQILELPPPALVDQIALMAPDAAGPLRSLLLPTLRALARRALRSETDREAIRAALLADYGPSPRWGSREVLAALIVVDREAARVAVESEGAEEARAALDAFPSSAAFLAELVALDLVPPSTDPTGLIDVEDALERAGRAAVIDVEGGLHGGYALETLLRLVDRELRGLAHRQSMTEGQIKLHLRDGSQCADFTVPLTGGDWFDLQAVLDALNAALARRGADVRVGARPGGQQYRVVVGPPDALASLARRGLLDAPERIPAGENARFLGIESAAIQAVVGVPTPAHEEAVEATRPRSSSTP